MLPAVPHKSSSLILGVDIGSSGLKAVLLDVEIGIVATSNHPLTLFSDHPGWAEADTDQWWGALCKAVPELIDQAKCKASDIGAVGVSGMVPAVVITDESGRALRRAMLQNDARATSEIRELAEKLNDVNLLELTGSKLTQQSIAPTALWLSRNESAKWTQTKMIMGSYDWMAFRLGSKSHVERNWAIESGLYGWDKNPIVRVIESTGITWPDLLQPEESGTPIGIVSALAAHETGLEAGTQIFVGAPIMFFPHMAPD